MNASAGLTVHGIIVKITIKGGFRLDYFPCDIDQRNKLSTRVVSTKAQIAGNGARAPAPATRRAASSGRGHICCLKGILKYPRCARATYVEGGR